ncbi:amidase [Pseudooceanicola sp. LIPI14-2-Ac024]|uniref:amidase n=1 Tax=Pseudooceanicola sp. LIPI14-2-Ac024 TaxID=3344875 RepID=UPI0035CFDEDE
MSGTTIEALAASGSSEARTRDLLARAAAEPTIFAAVEAETALAQARLCDAAGATRGPLHGVPLAHKDMFDRAGHVTGFGAAPGTGSLATRTATVLDRLDAAGQVDLGRLRMSEFAMGPTGHNHHWGIPRNPCRPGAISGGSSSGSGAAVAAGIVRAALGSDTGGSIRLPAACNGVVGFKPTQGRVPLTGAMPLSYTQDCIGPLAATVAEARLVLSVIAGPDGIDAACVDAPALRPGGSDLPDGLRIGFVTGGYLDGIAPGMARALDDLRAAMAGAGLATLEVEADLFDTLHEPANCIAMSEAAAVHADRLALRPDSYGDQLRTRLAQALAMTGAAYVRSRQIRSLARKTVREGMFGQVDLLIMPTLPDVPPMADAVNLGGDPKVAALISSLVRYTRPVNLLGLPSLSLPVLRGPEGPLSVQVVGLDWSEDIIADLGEWIEARCG